MAAAVSQECILYYDAMSCEFVLYCKNQDIYDMFLEKY